MTVEELYDVIEEHERRDKPRENHAIYLPELKWQRLKNECGTVSQFGNNPGVGGYDIIPDPYIRKPTVLATDVSNLMPEDMILSNPPLHLLKQLINVESKPYEDPIRDLVGLKIRQRVFLQPFCKWQRFNPDMVDKYGHPGTNSTLSVVRGEDYEVTKTDFEASEAVKFDRNFQTTRGGMAVENAKESICKAIYNTLHQVNSEPVYVDRTRTIKGPYPVLDIEHTETLFFGQRHTTYEGVVMVPYESIQTPKFEMRTVQ